MKDKREKIEKIEVVRRGVISTIDQGGCYDQAEQIEDKIFMIFAKLNEVIDHLNKEKEYGKEKTS